MATRTPLTIEEIISGIMTPSGGNNLVEASRVPVSQEDLIRELSAAPPPDPQPQEAKVGLGRGIGLALADALSTYAAGLSPNIQPQQHLERFRARRQQQLDRETEAQTRTQRQQFASRQQAIGAVLGMRQGEGEQALRREQVELQRAGQQQQLGIAQMEDDTRRSLADLEDRRMRDLATQSKVNPQLVKQENATWADVNAVLNAYRLGSDPKMSAKYKDRIAAGESMEDILTEVGWRLDEIPGVTPEQKELAITKLYVEMLQFEKGRPKAQTAPTGRDPVTGETVQIGPTRSPYNFRDQAAQYGPDILQMILGGLAGPSQEDLSRNRRE